MSSLARISLLGLIAGVSRAQVDIGPLVISICACGRSLGAVTTGLMRVSGRMNTWARGSLGSFARASTTN